MRRAFWPTLLGIMLILSGIFCLFSPVSSSTVIPYMIGIALTATGIGKLIRRADERRFYGQSSWSFAGAVVSLIFGILLMVSPTLQLSMGTTVVVLIGCWITIMGILRIVHAFHPECPSSVHRSWHDRCIGGSFDAVMRKYAAFLWTALMVLVISQDKQKNDLCNVPGLSDRGFFDSYLILAKHDWYTLPGTPARETIVRLV